MRYSKRILFFFLTLTLEFILSCSTAAVPASQPVNRQQPNHQETKLSSVLGWSPREMATSRQYLIQDSTVISTTTSTTQTQVTQTSTAYSIHINSLGDSLLLTARQDPSITISQFPFSKLSPNLTKTQLFHALLSLTGQIFSLAQDSTPLCSKGVAPAGIRVYDLVISYPTKMLGVGDEWSDTVSTTVCRGKNSLLQQAVRTYKILNFTTWKQQPAVAIRRIVTSILSTNSTQAQAQLNVSGSGKSSSFLYTDQITGILLQSDTALESTLTISTNRGVFPFNESINSHIELQ